MRHLSWIILLLPFLISCTALNQKDAFLESLSGKNTVFSEDFESGLGQWNQVSGTWTTGGSALISPASASASNFAISTVNNIDLSNKSNCWLQYDVRYSFTGVAGVYGQILFAGSVVGEFKNSTGTAALTSSGVFITKRAQLSSASGKLSILTGIANATSADVRFDNISITCNNANTSLYTIILDNFEGGTGNWTLNSNWALIAGVGIGGSNAIKATNTAAGVSMIATYQPNINLQGRAGCALNYYYSQVGSSQTANCIDLTFNGQHIRRDTANVVSLNVTQYLTVFESNSTNNFYFGCNIPGNNGQTAPCTIDNVTLTCQQ